MDVEPSLTYQIYFIMSGPKFLYKCILSIYNVKMVTMVIIVMVVEMVVVKMMIVMI